MLKYIILTVLLMKFCCCKITDKEYGIIPSLFYMDNYDECMLLEDEALYCTFTYELQPINPSNSSYIWKTIQKITSNDKNYQHDKLRHGICIPKTCTTCPKRFKSESEVQFHLNNFYDQKYYRYELKGIVKDMKCETQESKYPIDLYDKIVAIIFIGYLVFVITASLYEGVPRYHSKETYEKITSTKVGLIMSAFSIPKNWYRLTTVTSTPVAEELRCIQGIRCYNMIIVTLAHTVCTCLLVPVANTRYVETINEKFLNVFLSSGGLCVSTFFFITTWLLTYHFFDAYEGQSTIKPKVLLFTFINRYLRLTPLVAVIVIFHSTWLVHLSNGPYWDYVIGEEYRMCRKNWWINLLYLNNYLDANDMCLQTMWYLGCDMQYFILSLILIYYMKKYENKIPLILGGLFTVSILLVFSMNYFYGFNALLVPDPESLYMLRVFESIQWHLQTGSVYYNTGGPLMGFVFGYIYYKYRQQKLFTTKISVTAWWILTYGCSLGIIIFPGLLIFNETTEKNVLWASIFAAFSRPVFSFGIALTVFGMTQGIGWMTKWTCEWSPTYVLGRITYACYIVQLAVIKIYPATIRSPLYVNDYIIVTQLFSNLVITIMLGVVLTLLFEMPVTALQKQFLINRNKIASKIKEK